MQTVADMRGVGVKNRGKSADVLCGRPLNQNLSQAPSSSIEVLIREDKLDYLNNPSQDFKNSFCLGFL